MMDELQVTLILVHLVYLIIPHPRLTHKCYTSMSSMRWNNLSHVPFLQTIYIRATYQSSQIIALRFLPCLLYQARDLISILLSIRKNRHRLIALFFHEMFVHPLFLVTFYKYLPFVLTAKQWLYK